HISKLGRGKRIERVEDVLDLGDELTVRVDDVDPQGKVSLSPVGDLGDGDGDTRGADRPPVAVAAPRQPAGSAEAGAADASPERNSVSFEESFEAEAVEAVGGDMNAFTTKEYTSFYTRLLDEHLDLGLDILCDIMTAPAFRPDEVEAERQVILEEILMHEDEPSDVVHDLFGEALFPKHPLGREVLGTADTIRAMARDEIAGYFSAYYRPEAMVVAAAGNLDHDRVVEGLERRLGDRRGNRPPRSADGLGPPRNLIVASRPTEQSHLVVGVRGLARGDDDRFALAALNQVLGGGMSSRLFQEIREKRGLAYAVYSYRSAYLESGSLAIYAGTAPIRCHAVL